MTIDARTFLAAAFLSILSIVGCGASHRPDGLDVATLPEQLREPYQVFEVRCSRCHTLARPLNADIDDPAYWEDYVRRMRRQPGSGISRGDAAEILTFLRYYTAERLRREREEEGGGETPATGDGTSGGEEPITTPPPADTTPPTTPERETSAPPPTTTPAATPTAAPARAPGTTTPARAPSTTPATTQPPNPFANAPVGSRS